MTIAVQLTEFKYLNINPNPVLSSFMTYHRICNTSNTTDVTSGAGAAYPPRAREFNPGFSGVCVI